MEFQTNTTVSETHVQVNLRWDPGYVKTLPGALKVVAVVSCHYDLAYERQFVFISAGEYSGFYLRDVRLTLLQGAGSWRVVCICLDDRILGQPGVPDNVPHPRHGEVPCHSLAHDRVWVLCSLDVLLFFCSTGSCSTGGLFLQLRFYTGEFTTTIFAGPIQCTPGCSFFLRVRGNVCVRAGRRAQVPRLEGGAAGPGRAEGDADCHELAPLRRADNH